MFPIDDSVLSALNPEARSSLQELVRRSTITSPALVYRPVEHAIARNASHLGGFPCTNNFDWPKDKNGKPMIFLAQVNFESSNSCDQSISPDSGVLMLFISVDYTNFRAKDQSWYKLIYEPNLDSAENIENAEANKDFLPVAKLVPDAIEQLRWVDIELLMEKLPLDSLAARDKVITWFKFASSCVEERLKDAHQICCSDEQSQEACVMAAFYANGISFDQARKADVHYKHLVDYSSEWVVLWRLGGLGRFLPDEKRQLFICILRQNLVDLDFSKCSAVFL